MDHGKLIEEGTHEELMDQDGVYAKLVRIQTQVTAEPTVDHLVLANGSPADGADAGRRQTRRPADRPRKEWDGQPEVGLGEAAFGPRWLRPQSTSLQLSEFDGLEVRVAGERHGGVFAVRALPASAPDRYVSLRYADADGQEHEIGIVRNLADWPDPARSLIAGALERRYFIREITAIDTIELQYGLLSFRVQTDRGPAEFTMRNSHSQAQDYGKSGKLLIDVDDNRYVVRDIDRLPRRQQTLFRRYVYW
jgi:hypothetical protein